MSFSQLISILKHASCDIDYYISMAAAACEIDTIIKHINIKKTISCGFNHYTINLVVPKNQFEDDIYANNKELLDIVPRAYTIITNGSDSEEHIVSFVTGPCKFAGKTAIDEDPDKELSFKDTGIYDHSKVMSWADAGYLQITSSEKANGKFAICRLFYYNNIQYIAFGSKNYHITIQLDSLEEWLSDEAHDTPDNAIIYSVAVDIHTNLYRISLLMPTFTEGYTLCGELCDGQHFVSGDNTIEWFGFFCFGECLDTRITNQLLDSSGIKKVNSKVVFNPGDDIFKIDTIIKMSRCVKNEGNVLYFQNVTTGHIILCKTKSVRYILMRMLRQAIINRGYLGIDAFIKRVIDASDYHGLHTYAATLIAIQLIRFVFWMLEHKIPTNVLGVIPVVSVRGKLPTGFAIWWNQYLITTGTPDIDITLDDFGDFDKDVFHAAMDKHMKNGIRTNDDRDECNKTKYKKNK